jgi:hypothetical protein
MSEILLVVLATSILGLALKMRKLEKEVKELKNEYVN